MPAKSRAQQMAAAIAKHHPDILYKRNAGMKKILPAELAKLAATKGLKK